MRAVLILTTVLLLGALVFLYSANRQSTAGSSKTINSTVEAVAVNDTMCTSTTCMKKQDGGDSAETAASATSTKTEEPATITEEVTQVVKNIVSKIVPESKATDSTFQVKKYTEFVNPSGFVNSDAFSLADYIGKKVILIEFITYSCINCQRTFPYMQSWHEMYERDGLLVVGIHTPEFSYERDRGNVVKAMEKEGITFPIVMDNDYQTWNAYQNRFWPHRYVIDYDGNVVFDHIGEGAYTETETVIKALLTNKPT